MSSEPIASAPQASEAPGPEFIADAELVLAALSRMEAAVQADRAALAALRPALAEFAVALGNAKQAVTLGAERPLDIAMLLDALEQRVDVMIEIAGREPAPPPLPPPPTELAAPRDEDRPAEVARVPTVSAVVSQLGRDDESPVGPPEAAPSVSELAAMVQALSAPVPDAAAPSPETEASPGMEAVATAEPSPAPTMTESSANESAWLERIAELQALPADGVVSGATPDIDDLAELLFEPNPNLPAASAVPDAPASETMVPTTAQEPAPKETAAETRRSSPHDPLAPLYAMSPEERLALFS
jgi:hypothetical protein